MNTRHDLDDDYSWLILHEVEEPAEEDDTPGTPSGN